MFSFILFILFLRNIHSSPVCPGIPFDPPTNLSQITWYPSNFSQSSPPLFPNNFNCIYKINVPKGWSANIILTVNMTIPQDFAVSVTVFDQNNYSETVFSALNEHFFFVSEGGRIELHTREQNISFGFSIQWHQNQKFYPERLNVNISDIQPLVRWADDNNPYQIKAETRVSLVITPPNDDNLIQYLRSFIIYDGPDRNSPCLGNALKALNNMKQIVSSGQYLTFDQLSPYYFTERAMVVFQDYENTKDIYNYQGLPYKSLSGYPGINMDGTNGKAAITTVADSATIGAEYLTGLSGSGILDVYIGGKTASKSNLIASYNLSDASHYFPQEFLGYVRTYVLTGTNAHLVFNGTLSQFSSNSPIGRKGFFASRYYKSGTPSKFQDVYDYIRAPTKQLLTFSFTIRHADFVGNTTLKITVSKGGKNTYDQTFTSANRPSNSEVQAVGDDFSVQYKTSGYETTGYYLDFELLKSSNYLNIFTVFTFSFLFFLY